MCRTLTPGRVGREVRPQTSVAVTPPAGVVQLEEDIEEQSLMDRIGHLASDRRRTPTAFVDRLGKRRLGQPLEFRNHPQLTLELPLQRLRA